MEGFDLRLPLNAIFKRWLSFVQILGGVLGVVLLGWLIAPSKYTSTAVLMLESKRQEVIQVEKDNPSVSRATGVVIADVLSEVQILSSEEVRYRTLENLEPDLAQRIGLDPADEDSLAQGARRLKRGLNIEPVTNSSIINVSYSDRDPQLAVDLVNAFAQSYLEYRSGLSLTRSGLDGLEQEHERARLALSNAENKLRDFDKEFHLVAAAEQKSSLLGVLSGIRTDSAQKVVLLEKNKHLSSDLRQKLNQGSLDIAKIDEIRKNETTIYLESQLAVLRVELAELLQHNTEKSVEVIRVRQGIAGIEDALVEEREAVVRSLLYARDSETEGVRSEVAAYHDLEMAILEELNQIRDREIHSDNLKLELEIKRDSYTQVSKRLDQLRLEAALGGGSAVDVVVASKGYLPRGSSSPPSLIVLLMGALIGGTMLSLAVVLIMDSLDHSLKTPQEVEHFLGVPVLATLPKSKAEPADD